MNIVFNKDMVALPQRLMTNATSVPYDFYEAFGTEHGLFIPVTSSGFQFLRWVRKGMKDDITDSKDITSYYLHISNDGEVIIVHTDVMENIISFTPYSSKTFSMLCGSRRETAEALNYLMRDCKTVEEAVRVVEEGNMKGLYNPNVFFVNDWVEHAKKNGYVKNFYYTSFPSPEVTE
jgi:hypothetical protein